MIFGMIGLNELHYNNTFENDIIKVGILHPNFSTDRLRDHRKEEIIDDLIIEFNKVKRYKPDLVILPEAIFPYVFNDKVNYKEEIYREKFKVMYQNNTLIFGGLIRKDNRLHNSLIYINKDTWGYSNKSKLFPYGEYVPFVDTFPIFKKLFSKYIPSAIVNLSTNVNSKPFFITIKNKKYKMNSAICYEILFSKTVNNKTKNLNFMVNLGQGSWFDSPNLKENVSAAWSYIHLRARAIETGTLMFRSANTTGSYIIDYDGTTLNKVMPETNGFLVQDVNIKRNKPTLYNKYGDWFKYKFVVILFIFTLFFEFYNFKKE